METTSRPRTQPTPSSNKIVQPETTSRSVASSPLNYNISSHLSGFSTIGTPTDPSLVFDNSELNTPEFTPVDKEDTSSK